MAIRPAAYDASNGGEGTGEQGTRGPEDQRTREPEDQGTPHPQRLATPRYTDFYLSRQSPDFGFRSSLAFRLAGQNVTS